MRAIITKTKEKRYIIVPIYNAKTMHLEHPIKCKTYVGAWLYCKRRNIKIKK